MCPKAWIEHIVTQHDPEGIDYATTGVQPDERTATCVYALLKGELAPPTQTSGHRETGMPVDSRAMYDTNHMNWLGDQEGEAPCTPNVSSD